MTSQRRGKAAIELPNEFAIVVRREFDAPLELVFDVMTKPVHVGKTIAPFGEKLTVTSLEHGPAGITMTFL